MSKLQKKIILGTLLMVIGVMSFLYELRPICFIAFTALSNIVFFYDLKNITIGLVKLWCLSILIVLFILIGKNIFNTATPILVSSLIYLGLNILGAYLVSKTVKNEN